MIMRLFPFVYNPQTNKIIVLKQATFTLSYQLNGSQPIPPIGSTVSETRENYLSNFFNNGSITNSSNIIYRSSVLNTAEVVKGRYLIVTAFNQIVMPAITKVRVGIAHRSLLNQQYKLNHELNIAN